MGLKINLGKSFYISFEDQNRDLKLEEGNIKIKISNEYKYLGIPINNQENPDDDIKEKLCKGKSAKHHYRCFSHI